MKAGEDLPIPEGRVIEIEVEGADDGVEDDLLLLQLDVHFVREQLIRNFFHLKKSSNYEIHT